MKKSLLLVLVHLMVVPVCVATGVAAALPEAAPGLPQSEARLRLLEGEVLELRGRLAQLGADGAGGAGVADVEIEKGLDTVFGDLLRELAILAPELALELLALSVLAAFVYLAGKGNNVPARKGWATVKAPPSPAPAPGPRPAPFEEILRCRPPPSFRAAAEKAALPPPRSPPPGLAPPAARPPAPADAAPPAEKPPTQCTADEEEEAERLETDEEAEAELGAAAGGGPEKAVPEAVPAVAPPLPAPVEKVPAVAPPPPRKKAQEPARDPHPALPKRLRQWARRLLRAGPPLPVDDEFALPEQLQRKGPAKKAKQAKAQQPRRKAAGEALEPRPPLVDRCRPPCGWPLTLALAAMSGVVLLGRASEGGSSGAARLLLLKEMSAELKAATERRDSLQAEKNRLSRGLALMELEQFGMSAAEVLVMLPATSQQAAKLESARSDASQLLEGLKDVSDEEFPQVEDGYVSVSGHWKKVLAAARAMTQEGAQACEASESCSA